MTVLIAGGGRAASPRTEAILRGKLAEYGVQVELGSELLSRRRGGR
ncbi:hypothetical protein [Pseudonocardia sp. MH-G8]|nr:hypothetical protein [Pseudonocardia sp. MH-G8]